MRRGFATLALMALAGSAAILTDCAISTDMGSLQMDLPEGFAAEVYLPPIPPVSGGGVVLDSCPNPDGLDRLVSVTDDAAISLMAQLWSDDPDQSWLASDPDFWPVLGDVSPREPRPQPNWLDGPVRLASESPYADVLAQQCGETVVQAAWTFALCPPGCQA
jgi:hypothetical protein